LTYALWWWILTISDTYFYIIRIKYLKCIIYIFKKIFTVRSGSNQTVRFTPPNRTSNRLSTSEPNQTVRFALFEPNLRFGPVRLGSVRSVFLHTPTTWYPRPSVLASPPNYRGEDLQGSTQGRLSLSQSRPKSNQQIIKSS